MKEEFCIMNDNPPYWRNYRFNGSERHEIYEGRTGKLSIHLSPKEWEEKTRMKETAEKRWLEYYHKDIEDFIKKYGRNYL